MKRFALIKIISITILFSIFLVDTTLPTPWNNQYDPVAFHTAFGSNKFYSRKDKFAVSLNLSPFYQHASGSRNSKGRKVPEGDMFGRWNMFGLFYGGENEGMPIGKEWADYTNLNNAKTEVKKIEGRTLKDFTNEAVFNPDTDTFGLYSIELDYEKVGVRGQFNFDFGFGFGLNIKGGVVEYRQVPTFNLDETLTDTTSDIKDPLKQYLMGTKPRKEIAKEIDLDIDEYRSITLEDTHLQLYWNFPFDLKDEEDEHIVTWIPYLSVGCWMPTGKTKKQDIAFSLPTGNDGFIGFTLEGALNFDFPNMLQFGVGSGIVLYASKNYTNYRVPSSEYQSGIYPWKAPIRKKPGPVWYINFSFKADDIVDNLSFFFDYIYTQHQRDSITVMTGSKERNEYFEVEKLKEESRWKAGTIHAGLNYKVTPGLEFGASFQAPISGVRVYRDVTVMGTMTFNF
jgi:hypothetical protein